MLFSVGPEPQANQGPDNWISAALGPPLGPWREVPTALRFRNIQCQACGSALGTWSRVRPRAQESDGVHCRGAGSPGPSDGESWKPHGEGTPGPGLKKGWGQLGCLNQAFVCKQLLGNCRNWLLSNSGFGSHQGPEGARQQTQCCWQPRVLPTRAWPVIVKWRGWMSEWRLELGPPIAL